MSLELKFGHWSQGFIAMTFLASVIGTTSVQAADECPCFKETVAVRLCQAYKKRDPDQFRFFHNDPYRVACMVDQGSNVLMGAEYLANLTNPGEGKAADCRLTYFGKTGNVSKEINKTPITDGQVHACRAIMRAIVTSVQ